MAGVAAFALFLCLTQRADASSPVPLIIDTDIFHNADDVGALASAFALQQAGEANVIAITANSPTYRPAVATDSWKCIAAIANFYGSNAPIGSQMPDNGPDPNPPGPDGSKYAADCAALAPPSTPAPSPAVEVLRRALASQPDGSVVLAELGYQQNLADLLNSPADSFGPAGAALVAQKVRMLAVTGGWFPSSQGSGAESNLDGNIAAAQYVAQNWPTKIVWSGDEVGNAVRTGFSLPSTQPANSPVRVAYQAFVDPQYRNGPNIPSYDLTTIYHAIQPTDPGLVETGPGTNVVDNTGNNAFTADPTGAQYYLSLPDPTNTTPLETSIESLLDTQAPTGTVSGKVTDASTGAPLAGVAVNVADQFGNPLPGTTTAADGTYTLSGLHGGNYTISFVPGSGYQSGGYTGGVSVAGGGAVTGIDEALTVTPPSNNGPPSISGPAVGGQTLTESHGAWTNSPTGYSYQWEDCDVSGNSCSAIAGATSQTYTLTKNDVGHTVRVQETAIKETVPSATAASSAATGVVQSAAVPVAHVVPSNSSLPVISGTPKVGATLTSSSGAWSGTAPVSYAYQWERCAAGTCAAISGATDTSYTLTRADSGARIVVRVAATNSAGSSSATSAAAGPVAIGRPTRAQVRAALRRSVVVSGSAARIGRLLTHRGYTARFAAPATGHLVITWYAVPKGAHHRAIVVAVARVTFNRAVRAKVKITLTRRGRTLLERSARLRVIVKARFTPRGGPTTTTTRTIHLRR